MDEEQGSWMAADSMPMRYLGSSCHGGTYFQIVGAPASVHAGGEQLIGVPVDMSSLMPRIGMIPTGFEIQDGALVVNGFDDVGGVPVEVAMSPQQVSGSYNVNLPPPQKATWTMEEDNMLREMVKQHGEGKWSAIARCLPGRIGKQCRERWINHLRPDIKQNDVWTEDDDRMLIDAHRYHGNRWSAIARYLPGRTENAIKNHWNATLRSLKARRRLKKKKSEQAPPGQFTILEEYIRSVVCPVDGAPPPSSAPPHNLAYDSLLIPAVPHAPEASFAVPTNTYMMTFNGNNSSPGASNQRMINLNMPPQSPDLNTTSDPHEYNLSYPMYVPAPSTQLHLATHQENPQQACSSVDLFPYADYIALLRTDLDTYYAGASSSNPGANRYYSEEGRSSAGGSGDRASDTDDMVRLELVSREFLMPSDDEVTLDLTRFK